MLSQWNVNILSLLIFLFKVMPWCLLAYLIGHIPVEFLYCTCIWANSVAWNLHKVCILCVTSSPQDQIIWGAEWPVWLDTSLWASLYCSYIWANNLARNLHKVCILCVTSSQQDQILLLIIIWLGSDPMLQPFISMDILTCLTLFQLAS